ncbi:MAG TPA: hypothetical protein VME86_03775 [Acidobacteriaceae bacterium]|nr:hypothetical protein [Acidobacteriaceae bacterium]
MRDRSDALFVWGVCFCRSEGRIVRAPGFGEKRVRMKSGVVGPGTTVTLTAHEVVRWVRAG